VLLLLLLLMMAIPSDLPNPYGYSSPTKCTVVAVPIDVGREPPAVGGYLILHPHTILVAGVCAEPV
jgi:hypothetical protein